jgi:hypothetical protein
MGLPQNWFTIQAPSTLGGTVVHSTTNSLTVFFNASGTMIEQRYVTGSGWQAQVSLGAPPHGLTWDPDAASAGGGHIDLYARDGDGELVDRAYDTATGWTGWRENGVAVASSPAVVDPVAGETDVVWLAANHTLQTMRWTQTGGWTAPVAIPKVTNAGSGPDATTLVTSKDIVVVYRGTDGRFWTVTRSGGSWRTPAMFDSAHPLPVAAKAVDPSITNSGGNNPNVFYTGANGVVYHASGNPASVWYSVPSSGTTSGPDTWADLPTHTDVISGHAGVVGTAAWSSTGGWRSWQPLP